MSNKASLELLMKQKRLLDKSLREKQETTESTKELQLAVISDSILSSSQTAGPTAAHPDASETQFGADELADVTHQIETSTAKETTHIPSPSIMQTRGRRRQIGSGSSKAKERNPVAKTMITSKGRADKKSSYTESKLKEKSVVEKKRKSRSQLTPHEAAVNEDAENPNPQVTTASDNIEMTSEFLRQMEGYTVPEPEQLNDPIREIMNKGVEEALLEAGLNKEQTPPQTEIELETGEITASPPPVNVQLTDSERAEQQPNIQTTPIPSPVNTDSYLPPDSPPVTENMPPPTTENPQVITVPPPRVNIPMPNQKKFPRRPPTQIIKPTPTSMVKAWSDYQIAHNLPSNSDLRLAKLENDSKRYDLDIRRLFDHLNQHSQDRDQLSKNIDHVRNEGGYNYTYNTISRARIDSVEKSRGEDYHRLTSDIGALHSALKAANIPTGPLYATKVPDQHLPPPTTGGPSTAAGLQIQ